MGNDNLILPAAMRRRGMGVGTMTKRTEAYDYTRFNHSMVKYGYRLNENGELYDSEKNKHLGIHVRIKNNRIRVISGSYDAPEKLSGNLLFSASSCNNDAVLCFVQKFYYATPITA